MKNEEIIVQVTTPRDLATDLRGQPVSGVEFEPPPKDREETTRFGVAEALLIIGVCQGVLTVVKLTLEIRNLLRDKPQKAASTGRQARITTPDGRLQLDISADDTDEELERRVRESLESHKNTNAT